MVTRCLVSCALAVAILGAVDASVAKAQTGGPSITSPTKDQVLQGQVTITGTTGASNFASAELAFAYVSDRTNTWFVIQTLAQPVEAGPLADWDTTRITDGDYVMRLRVFTSDGSFQDAEIPFVVANYTLPAVAAATPTPTEEASIQIPTAVVVVPSATSAPTELPAPTPLPPNPAAMQTDLVYRGLGQGALIAAALFVVLGAILLRRRP